MSPTEVVAAQIEAFNAKDLEAFLQTYAEDIRILDVPDRGRPPLIGKAALRTAFAPAFANAANTVVIRSRMTVGNKVIDHEHVIGHRPEPYDVVAVYEVHDGRIAVLWFFAPDTVSFPAHDG